ncbi:MAG: putative translation initiation factor IF-2 [Methanomassiliicoccales archaeon PtaU1.Bin124]|nr:MAG: putative translation initiation factor IF-2 [Methanomassiliicoccales archaeon PtaU1.Bin124]
MTIRQPIVSVLGHVDHGKTSLLDYIRGTTVSAREAGFITQHIGATEVPLEHIEKVCAQLMGKKKFNVPGLLFIDTPGHQSFTSLRARGGSLADIAILVIDINEGLKPQTIESINILRRYKTPFIIAMNKIDLIDGWISNPKMPFILSEKKQMEEVQERVNMRMYDIIGRISMEGLSADRYDRIEDFTKNIALVPVSAKTGEGIPDLLLVLIGLAQRFLEGKLNTEEGPAKGTILEVKEEKGLGQTIDVIVYSGTLHRGDTVALGTRSGKPLVTKVKAVLKPKPLDEIRDPRDRFDSVREISAAAGVKVSCQTLEGVLAGAPLRVIDGNQKEVLEEIASETKVNIKTEESGIMVKADAIGSLEALAFEADKAKIPIRKYEVGDISRRDLIEVSAYNDPYLRVILGFNINMLPDAKDALASHDVKVFNNNVVYGLIDEYQKWLAEEKRKAEEAKRASVSFPAKFRILPNCVFRVSKPAIVGVRVLAGRLRNNMAVVDRDGKDIGRIKSLRSGEDTLKEALAGQEVAIAIDGPTVGRQIDVEDVLYVDILESEYKNLADYGLNEDEKMVLEEIGEIKRRQDPFWGM